ncbi:MAG: sigma-54 dependent transcriptional regulator [Opitutaceae bacterium]|nr:sigma-54 dependent transcriptional regulator [Opitutaceae bacterium]
MSLEKILVLDDEPLVLNVLGDILRRKHYQVSTARCLAEAEALVSREPFDILFVDMRLPDGDGHQFLERVRLLPERPAVVMITGHGTIESAVSCMRAGAFDYLIKPFTPGQIEVVIKKAEAVHQLITVNRYFSEREGPAGEIIGRSPLMQRLRQIIERVAQTDATILITGESGTGKEMVARELYRHSPRRQESYIKVNCAAVSENLIESEFFGHEKGAFTGASERREGRFELAHRGTLLLDEVSEIPLNLQAKLLRVLQEREFERVGGNKTIKVNVRILATSNRDLLHCVERGEFRQDLYYRLNVFPVHVPPLRERREDILDLADYFLQRFARKHGIRPLGFSDNARAAIQTYAWPGNVRELQNTVERAVILTEDNRFVSCVALGLPNLARSAAKPLPPPCPRETAPWSPAPAPEADGRMSPVPAAHPEPAAAPVAGLTPPPGPDDPAVSVPVNGHGNPAAAAPAVIPLEEVERQHILSALHHTNGNRTRTATLLGISIRTLRNKLQEYRAIGTAADADDGAGA